MSAVNTDTGTILEALNDKLDRNMDNLDTTTQGPDVVVDWQVPTAANDYKWYRKYKSGWVEQGGIRTSVSNAVMTMTLPIEMANTNYAIQISRGQTDSTVQNSINSHWPSYWAKTTTSFGCWDKWGDCINMSWEVKGFAAE